MVLAGTVLAGCSKPVDQPLPADASKADSLRAQELLSREKMEEQRRAGIQPFKGNPGISKGDLGFKGDQGISVRRN